MVQPAFFRGDKTSSLSPASSFVLLGLEAFNANKQHNQQIKKKNMQYILFWNIFFIHIIKKKFQLLSYQIHQNLKII